MLPTLPQQRLDQDLLTCVLDRTDTATQARRRRAAKAEAVAARLQSRVDESEAGFVDDSFDILIDVRLIKVQHAVIDVALVMGLIEGLRRRGPMTMIEARRWLGLPAPAAKRLRRLLDRWFRRALAGEGQRKAKWSL